MASSAWVTSGSCAPSHRSDSISRHRASRTAGGNRQVYMRVHRRTHAATNAATRVMQEPLRGVGGWAPAGVTATTPVPLIRRVPSGYTSDGRGDFPLPRSPDLHDDSPAGPLLRDGPTPDTRCHRR